MSMLALKQPSVRFLDTSRLSAVDRTAIVRLCNQRGVDTSFVLSRYRRYPLIAILNDAWGLAAFQLMDARPAAHATARDLVYLGPLVSARGAYVPLFAAIVERLVATGRPFWAASEIETPRVLATLTRLLPTRAFPAAQCTLSSADTHDVLAGFAAAYDHIEGFDPSDLTTRVTQSIGRCASPEAPCRYTLTLFGSDGLPQQGSALLAELRDGLAALKQSPSRRRTTARLLAAALTTGGLS